MENDTMNCGNIIYKIRDSVDLYLSNNKQLTIYYINTRKRKEFKISEPIIFLLEHIDGVLSLDDLYHQLSEKYGIVDENEFEELINKMHVLDVITEVNEKHILSEDYRIRFNRQINYFSEFVGNEQKAESAMLKLMSSKVLIFGCGSVGGDIAIQLAMAGVEHFVLFDYDRVEASDIARHIWFDKKYIGMYKVDALSVQLKKINSMCKVDTVRDKLIPEYDIEKLVLNSTFVINTADEPYIGYTAAKISRMCIKHNICHYIGGGFDAHLASTGEIIIPYVTPCVECYAEHFKETLKDWKPKKHPVLISRYKEVGGLASMSLFSASFATIEIIKCICGLVDIESEYKTRGELLTEKMDLMYIQVQRDENCEVCGKQHGKI